MRRLFGTLRSRLLLSHLAVVAVGVVVLLVAGRSLGDAFIHDHLRSMNHMMGGMSVAEAGHAGTVANHAGPHPDCPTVHAAEPSGRSGHATPPTGKAAEAMLGRNITRGEKGSSGKDPQ